MKYIHIFYHIYSLNQIFQCNLSTITRGYQINDTLGTRHGAKYFEKYLDTFTSTCKFVLSGYENKYVNSYKL